MLSINVTPARDYCNSANELAASVSFAVTGGAFYTSAPDVAFSGGGGSGAVAHAVVENGVVTSIVIDDPGSSYETAPTITIGGVTSGGGSGATATATVDGGGLVDSITVTNGGGKTLTFTDNTAYASGEARKAVNISVFDRHGGKVEAQIEAADVDDAIVVTLEALSTYDGVDALVTVLSDLGNVKDGSAYDLLVRAPGSFNMEK